VSTRANIVLYDQSYRGKMWFYKHSDGYPEGTLPLILRFMKMVEEGQIRRNTVQAGGWMVLLGMQDHAWMFGLPQVTLLDYYRRKAECSTALSWKIGSVEPTTGQHGDIEWLYRLDLLTNVLQYGQPGDEEDTLDPVVGLVDYVRLVETVREMEAQR